VTIDRALRTERGPGAHGHRRGDRFGHRRLDGESALVLEHRVHGFGDAVTAHQRLPPGEQGDDHAAQRGDGDDPPSGVDARQLGHLPGDLSGEREAQQERGDVEEQPADEAACDPDDRGQGE